MAKMLASIDVNKILEEDERERQFVKATELLPDMLKSMLNKQALQLKGIVFRYNPKSQFLLIRSF